LTWFKKEIIKEKQEITQNKENTIDQAIKLKKNATWLIHTGIFYKEYK